MAIVLASMLSLNLYLTVAGLPTVKGQENSPPISNAGPDQTVNEGVVVTLDGSGSSDPDGNPLSYSWLQKSGPAASLSNATAQKPTFSAPEIGATSASLVFELTVNDGTANSKDTITITINNIAGYHYTPSFSSSSANYFDIPDNALLRLQRFSVAAWFKTSTDYSTNGVIVNKGGFGSELPGQNMNYGIWLTNQEKIQGGFESADGTDYYVTATPLYNDGNWHYAVLTYDGSALRMYVDGVQVGWRPITATPDSGSNQPLRIGRNSQGANNYFTGGIDEVRMWNRAITAAEVSGHYSTGVFDSSGQLVYMNGVNYNSMPTANAGPDQTVNEGTLVTLNGAASSDPDDDIIQPFSWTQTSGPAVALSNPSSATPTFTAPDVGSSGSVLGFRLTVTDSKGGNGSDTVVINVQSQNQLPVADAGSNQTVSENVLVSLDGTFSSDPDGDTLSYSWIQTGGAGVTLSSANTATPTFTSPAVGPSSDALTFQLTVSDGNSGNATDTTSVLVQNSVGVTAQLSANSTIVEEGKAVELDASNSTGANLTYQFNQISGTPGTIIVSGNPAIATFEAPSPVDADQVATLRVNVTDTMGESASKTVEVLVKHVNISPTDKVSVTANSVAASGYHYSPAFVAAGSGSSYFDIPDHPSQNVPKFSVAAWFITSKNYSSDGIIANKAGFGLESAGNNANYALWIDNTEKLRGGFETTTGANNFVSSSATLSNGSWQYAVVTFNGSIVRLYVNGTQVSSLSTTAVPDLGVGTAYPIRIGANPQALNSYFKGQIDEVRIWNRALTAAEISDQYNQGTFNTTGQLVYMDGVTANQSPIANAGPNQTRNEGTLVTLNGAGSSDPDGDSLTYSWTQTAGPSVTLSGANSATPTFTAPDVGSGGAVLSFRLTVGDGKGGASSDTVNINVQNTNQPPVANAGPNQTVNEGTDEVILDGSASSDPDGDSLTYSWTQTAGPAVALDDPTAQNPTFTAPIIAADTSLSFSLTVNDTKATSTDSVTIFVINTAGGYDYLPSFNATGASKYDIPNHSGLKLTRFSVAAWFKTSNNFYADAMIANKGGFGNELPGQNMNYGIWITSQEKLKGGFESADGTDYYVTATKLYNDSNWHYAVLTYDGSALRLYADGVQIGWRPISATPDNTGVQPLRIGANSQASNNYFKGQIDEVRVWKQALFATEVADQYLSGIFNNNGLLVYMDGVTHDNTPVANAGPDQTKNEGTLVTLNGAGSSDPDGTPITYSWTQISGPPVSLSNPHAQNPTFTAPIVASDQVLGFMLTVSDGKVDVTDTVNITVINTAGGYLYLPPYDLEGTNYMQIPDSSSLRLANFSVAAWFKTTSTFTSDAMIVNKGGMGSELSGQNLNYGIWIDNAQKVNAGFETLAGQNQFVVSPDTYNDGNWHYAVLTYANTVSPKVVNLYMDGVLVSSLTVTSSGPDNTGPQPLRIGGNSLTADRYFTGQIDEIRVWNRQIPLSEVQNQYLSGIFNSAGLVKHIDMAHAPIADAGSIQMVAENTQTSLNGAGSSDPDGTPLSFSWIQLSGPAANIQNPTTATPTITTPSNVSGESSMIFQVNVTDGQYTAADSVRIVVFDPSIDNKILKTPDYMADVANEIGNATGFVYAAMFYIDDYSINRVINALDNAVDRGVDVRVMLSPQTLQIFPDAESELISRGIPYKIIANHAKVVVIDNKTAYVGSANWNKNGLERNWELTLKTNNPDTIQEAYEYDITLWNTTNKIINYNDYYYERFANGPEFYGLLLEQLQNAGSIKMLMFQMTYNFTDANAVDSKVLNELKNAYNSGANLQLILDDPRYYEIYGGRQFLTQNNIPHKLDDLNTGTLERVHAKAILIDDKVLFIGSQNWDRDALNSPEEASIITRNPETISEFQTIFNAKWALAHNP